MYELRTGIKCPPNNPLGHFYFFHLCTDGKKLKLFPLSENQLQKHSHADPDMLTNETKKNPFVQTQMVLW